MNSDLIKRFREQKGWSQQQLADELGVNRNTINRWEMGIRSPSQSMRSKLNYLINGIKTDFDTSDVDTTLVSNENDTSGFDTSFDTKSESGIKIEDEMVSNGIKNSENDTSFNTKSKNGIKTDDEMVKNGINDTSDFDTKSEDGIKSEGEVVSNGINDTAELAKTVSKNEAVSKTVGQNEVSVSNFEGAVSNSVSNSSETVSKNGDAVSKNKVVDAVGPTENLTEKSNRNEKNLTEKSNLLTEKSNQLDKNLTVDGENLTDNLTVLETFYNMDTNVEKQVQTYYEAMYRDAKGIIPLCIITQPQDSQQKPSLQVKGFYDISQIPALLAEAERLNGNYHIYTGIHPLRKRPSEGRGKEKDILGIALFAADVDAKDFIEDKVEKLKANEERAFYRWTDELLSECKACARGHINSVCERVSLPPTAVIDSGHGYYPIFKLDRFVEFESDQHREELKKLNKALHEVFSADSTFDFARILRVIETRNIKPGYPTDCRLIEFHPDRRYTLDDIRKFEKLLFPPPEQQSRPVEGWVRCSVRCPREGTPSTDTTPSTVERIARLPQAIFLDDQALIEKAKNAKDGVKFSALWNGDISFYKSQSEADLALCCLLAFWTGGDYERIDRLFRQSGLYRSKWDRLNSAGEEDYKDKTINAALEYTTEYYDPDKQAEGIVHTEEGVVSRTLNKAFPIYRDIAPSTEHSPVEGVVSTLKEVSPACDAPVRGRLPLALTPHSTLDAIPDKVLDAMAEQNAIVQEVDLFQKKKTKEDFCPYFKKDTFIPKLLADDILANNRFINVKGLLYRYLNGVYIDDGEQFIEAYSQKKLGNESRQNRISETVYFIKVDSYTEPELVNPTDKGHLINVQNGLYDWIEGKLLPHTPDHLSTIRIPIEYKKEATCPTVDYFLESTLPKDCIPIAEELFGYALIPYVRFEKAFMFTGTGANGKSTFLTLLEKFVGSGNVSKVPLQDLDEHRFKRAELFGKLLNLFADLDARDLQSSTYFKTIVSGDAIDAERKFQDPFFFRPFARLAFSANEIPRSPDNSYAYFRRWCIIPFPKRFEGRNADKSLADKMTEPDELSGLLNRALRGLHRLFNNEEFTESATIKASLDDYKKQNDTVAAFVNDCCVFDVNAETERGELFTAYQRYCESEGYKEISRIACYNRIRAHSQISEKREMQGKRYFTGIKIQKTQ